VRERERERERESARRGMSSSGGVPDDDRVHDLAERDDGGRRGREEDDDDDEREIYADSVRRRVEDARYPSYQSHPEEEKENTNTDFMDQQPPTSTEQTSKKNVVVVDDDEIDDYARTLGASSTFFCPVSLELLKDPVVVRTGQTYERSSVEDWIRRGGRTCPATGQPLAEANESIVRMAPNFALRSAIQEWAKRTCPEILNEKGDVRGMKGSPVVGMTEMRLVSSMELRDIELNTAPPVIGRRGDTLDSNDPSDNTSSRRSGIVRRMMSLSNAVPNFIANVNREISRTQHFVNQTQRRVFDAIDGRRNPRNNDNNNSNSRNSNNNERQQQQQQQQNGSYWMQNEEIPPELPSTYRSIQTGPPIRRGDSWFYPVAPSRDEAAFHERNNFGFRNPQTHQNWIEIRRDGDAVETAVAYRVSLRLLPVARNQQNVRWVFLFAILLSMMFGIQIVFCNSASWSRSGNSFLGPSKFEMAKSSCIAGNLGWLVTEKTEIWRLFTSIFAVGNVVTFAITMLSLLFMAAPIERNIGGYIAVPLFFGPFVGIIASTYFLNDHVTTGGLSAIAAVLPLCYADYWKTKELSFLHCFGFAIFLIVMIMGYSPFTDNLTQLFAFLFGMATTGIYYSPERPSLTSQQVKSAQAGFLLLLGFIFLLPLLLLFVSNPMKSGGDDANSAINGFTCMPSEMMGPCDDDVLTWREYYEIPPSPVAVPISPSPPFPSPPPPSPPPLPI